MSWTRTRAELARTVRLDPGNTERISELRRQLRADRAMVYLQHLVDQFPPLTAEQIGRLQTILAGAHAEVPDATPLRAPLR